MAVQKNKTCPSPSATENTENPYSGPLRPDIVQQKGHLDQNKDFRCANPSWGTDK